MLQYVGISLVIVVAGLVIAMTAGAVCRAVLKEFGDYKDKQNQKAIASITKMTETVVGGIAEAVEKKAKKDMETRKEITKSSEQLNELWDKILKTEEKNAVLKEFGDQKDEEKTEPDTDDLGPIKE